LKGTWYGKMVAVKQILTEKLSAAKNAMHKLDHPKTVQILHI
jgi:hypothetical protein